MKIRDVGTFSGVVFGKVLNRTRGQLVAGIKTKRALPFFPAGAFKGKMSRLVFPSVFQSPPPPPNGPPSLPLLSLTSRQHSHPPPPPAPLVPLLPLHPPHSQPLAFSPGRPVIDTYKLPGGGGIVCDPSLSSPARCRFVI